MSKSWDAACAQNFIEKVRQVLTDYRKDQLPPRDAIENIAYEFEDQIGDLGVSNAVRAS